MAVSILSKEVLTTDRSAGIVVPARTTSEAASIAVKLRKKLLGARICPTIYVMANAHSGPASSFLAGEKHVSLAIGKGMVGERVFRGFAMAYEDKLDATIFFPTDFDHLVASVPKFMASIDGNNRFSVGAWDAKTKDHMPHAQYLSEMYLSGLLSYLGEKYPKDARVPIEDPEAFRKQAENYGAWHQTWTGIIGINSGIWPEIAGRIETAFKGVMEHVHFVAYEPAMQLSAMDSGVKISHIAVPRRYEHVLMGREEDDSHFVSSRLKLFEHALDVLKAYARQKTAGKMGTLGKLGQRAMETIAASHFQWPDRDVKQSEWNSPQPSSYQPK